eukprot:2767537-Rhodomonas_salina.1
MRDVTVGACVTRQTSRPKKYQTRVWRDRRSMRDVTIGTTATATTTTMIKMAVMTTTMAGCKTGRGGYVRRQPLLHLVLHSAPYLRARYEISSIDLGCGTTTESPSLRAMWYYQVSYASLALGVQGQLTYAPTRSCVVLSAYAPPFALYEPGLCCYQPSSLRMLRASLIPYAAICLYAPYAMLDTDLSRMVLPPCAIPSTKLVYDAITLRDAWY